jgi:dipeptidyl-peptidase 4
MRKADFPHILFLLILFTVTGMNPAHSQPSGNNDNMFSVLGWSDDSHYIIRMSDATGKTIINKVDIKTGKAEPLPSATPEQDKLKRSLPGGVTINRDDVISPDMRSVLKAIDNDLYLYASGAKEPLRLTRDEVPEINARFSPDSRKIAYTKSKDLYVYDLGSGQERRLTFDAGEKIYNGYSSWVYMEEILGRPGHYAAFWWSPDGNRLAFLRTDETEVPVFTLNRLDEPDGVHGKTEVTPYPKAGDPNPKVRMGIADVNTSGIVWIKTDYEKDQYLAWPFWTPDSKKIALQVLDRDQNHLEIILADVSTGGFVPIFHESRRTWVEFHEDVYVMMNGSGFILRSSGDDWSNLYYYSWDGKLKSKLTDFDFRVREITRVDEKMKIVYFTATGRESTDRQYYRVGLDGRNLLQLTSGSGTHNLTISPGGSYYIDTWNNISSAGSIIAYDNRARMIREIYIFEQPDPVLSSKTELVRIPTSDGLFSMPALITYPIGFDPARKYPVIFTIYGGPDYNNVVNKWQGDIPSWYSLNGIITFTVDHRGSGHFGKRGLDYLYRSLGKWEIQDYSDAVKWLLSKTFVDSTRMGITGSSYGGYLTCLALTKGAAFWTHGFAVAPVTDFRLYDNVYTERYMDTPRDNPEGYRDGSALTYANSYRGMLYICHGDIDDNVHLQNSIYLISRMEEEGKSFRFMLYPGDRHGWGGAKAAHLRNEQNSFWLSNFFQGE